MTLVDTARIFATAAHAATGQKRKYTGEDYIVHPAEVAAIVASLADATDEMIAAAWLHDVLEDTGVTPDQMREVFGDKVTELVLWLTDVSQPGDGNRSTRKAIDRQHSASAPADAQTIKLADLISNTRSITEHDPDFAKVYLKEKAMLLDVMTFGDTTLMAHARQQIG
jgi:(p)ppGpp synthase/HD superfamily hydrolase